MDLYEALIGEGPSDPQRQKALAEQLRKRSRYGQLGVLTGDKAMGAVGGNLMRSADQFSGDLQGIRERGIDNARASANDAADNEYRGNALKQAMEIARMNDARQRELAQLSRQAMGQNRLDKAAATQDAMKDRSRIRLGEYMDKNGLTALAQSVGDLNNIMAQYKGKDIPGSGGLANTWAGKINPSLEAKNVQSAKASVVNAILRAQSGLAVTAPEAERMIDEISGNAFSSDEAFMAAIQRVNEKLTSRLQGLKAAYGSDVVNEYMQDGGLMAVQGGPASAGAVGPVQGSGPAQPMPSTPSSAGGQAPAQPQAAPPGMSRLEYLRRKRDGLIP